MFSKLELHMKRPYLLLLPVIVATALIAKAYYPGWWGCQSFSEADRSKIVSYLSRRYGLGDSASIKVTPGAILQGACIRRLSVVAPRWAQEQTFYLSPDKRYLSRDAGDLDHTPKSLLTAKPATAEKSVDMGELTAGNPPSVGPENAPVTLVEFSDFQCPYCKQLAIALTGKLLSDEKKQVRIVFRQYPLPFHSHAKEEAELSACVAQQSIPAFWNLHDYLFGHQPSGKDQDGHADVIAAALTFLRTQRDVSVPTVQTCMSSHSTAGLIDADIKLAEKYGVTGTPTFFVNSERRVGALDEASLRDLIEKAKQSKQQPPGAAPNQIAAATDNSGTR